MSEPNEPKRKVFSAEIRLGDIAIVVSLVAPLILFYADVTKTLGNHETRILSVERQLELGRAERLAFQTEMRVLVQTIREDLASIKATMKFLEGTKRGDTEQR